MFCVMKESAQRQMSSAQKSVTIALAVVAVLCLVAYGVKRHGETSATGDLGASGGLDCSGINPGHANWARCAQGSAKGRIPSKRPSKVVRDSMLDFASDSIKHQGLGVGRLQDDFVKDQYNGSLGAPSFGGMRIDKTNLKNNSFFSQGTENPTHLVTSGISAEAAAAFPFSTKSSDDASSSNGMRSSTFSSSNVSGTEPVGMGMKLASLKRGMNKNFGEILGGGSGGARGASRPQVNKKLGVAPFDDHGSDNNPFVGSTADVGSGLKLSEAYGSLGAAVSPFSSSTDVGVSPAEISAATASLNDVNIVQNTEGGFKDRFIRP